MEYATNDFRLFFVNHDLPLGFGSVPDVLAACNGVGPFRTEPEGVIACGTVNIESATLKTSTDLFGMVFEKIVVGEALDVGGHFRTFAIRIDAIVNSDEANPVEFESIQQIADIRVACQTRLIRDNKDFHLVRVDGPHEFLIAWAVVMGTGDGRVGKQAHLVFRNPQIREFAKNDTVLVLNACIPLVIRTEAGITGVLCHGTFSSPGIRAGERAVMP